MLTCVTMFLILVCSESEFRCSNGYCVDMSNYCDGYDNCGDSSDATTTP